VEVICLGEDGAEDRCEVIEVARHELAMETLGLNLAEAKAILGVTGRDILPLRGRLLSGWFLRFFPASAVG
jgi:hypothetical protein